MGKLSNPISFSSHFEIEPEILDDCGVLNPSLNVDTKLFIDPFLLSTSSHPEISKTAYFSYRSHFETVIKLLAASKNKDDVAWRNAKRMLQFPEINGTCLGYGASSISGSGSGAFTTDSVIQTAKEVVDLGIDDPDLFVALGIFETGIGPDQISDMTTNVIFGDLLTFNARVLTNISVPLEKFEITLRNGNEFKADLPRNPLERKKTPVILVPKDVLRKLPIASDWSDVSDAASKNAALRSRVNKQIAEIWKLKTLKEKHRLKEWATSSQQSFEDFLALLKSAEPRPYDFQKDPLGELIWRRIAELIATEQPFKIEKKKTKTVDDIKKVVDAIVNQFLFLIEERRLSEELYVEDKPRPEHSAQRIFFAVAYSYCKSNNLDITPEADTGNGPVDFKVSSGFDSRVIVEIKLSTNTKLIAGYERQLEKYRDAEETSHGYFVVIDVGRMGRKDQKLMKLKNDWAKLGHPVSEIVLIDGKRRKSASKL